MRGPLVDQIDAAVTLVLDELAQGLTLSSSGFKTQHVYPERVVKEAIVNAVVHRDYRLNRDIFIRIFDDRVEVESPGVFPGRHHAGKHRAGWFTGAQPAHCPEPAGVSGGAQHRCR